MPLWIGSYLADTQHLERHEHGAYLLLLMAYWRNGGPLPDDDKRLASIAKCSPKEWKDLRQTMADFFQVDAGQWSHKRVEHELACAKDRASKAKRKAQAAAQARWKQSSEQCSKHAASNAPSMPQAMHKECPTPSPSNTSVPNGTDGKPSPVPVDNSQPPGLSDTDGIWSQGVPFLIAAGVTEVRARSMLGGLIKSHGAARVWSALQGAIKERPIEPVSWLQAAILKVPGVAAQARKTSHQGFNEINYTAGVNADGTLA